LLGVDVQTKSTQGMSLSYRLHKLLQSSSDSALVRGSRQSDKSEMSVASSLYTLVRGNRANRRYLLMTLLKLYEDDSVRYKTWYSFIIKAVLPDYTVIAITDISHEQAGISKVSLILSLGHATRKF